MEVSSEPNSWRDELASLVEDTGITVNGDPITVSAPEFSTKPAEEEAESLKDQIKGFAKAWGELVVELGRGCRDVVQQTILTEDSYIVKKTRGPLAEVSEKLRFLNEFLPEDRDPVHVWPVIFFVFVLTLAGNCWSLLPRFIYSVILSVGYYILSCVLLQSLSTVDVENIPYYIYCE